MKDPTYVRRKKPVPVSVDGDRLCVAFSAERGEWLIKSNDKMIGLTSADWDAVPRKIRVIHRKRGVFVCFDPKGGAVMPALWALHACYEELVDVFLCPGCKGLFEVDSGQLSCGGPFRQTGERRCRTCTRFGGGKKPTLSPPWCEHPDCASSYCKRPEETARALKRRSRRDE